MSLLEKLTQRWIWGSWAVVLALRKVVRTQNVNSVRPAHVKPTSTSCQPALLKDLNPERANELKKE